MPKNELRRVDDQCRCVARDTNKSDPLRKRKTLKALYLDDKELFLIAELFIVFVIVEVL